MENELPTAVAVTVLTGFLGSGKTTLLNHLVQDQDLGQSAILINEFGDVSIDHLLVEHVDETTVLLESGCVCCSVRSDLVNAMKELIAKRADGKVPPFERLIIETTGLADPAPILHTLMTDPLIAGQFRLDGLVTVVDGALGLQTLENHPEAVKQAAIADRLVISKVDIASDLEALIARLQDLNPAAPQIQAQHGQVPVTDIIDAGLFDADFTPHVERWLGDDVIKDHHHHHHNHDAGIDSFVLEADTPIDFMAFQDWLGMVLATQGEGVLRMKGIMDVKDVDRPIAIHGVQHLIHPPAALENWEGLDKRSRLVFITKNLSKQAIRDTFAAYLPGTLTDDT
ncbi:GTP-binding protein [Magnetovibrio sp. PR-2]|uniref:CobW family GTP-binding protein n=1 Tax=Magnetovibrio sp. PR-2 TaxID=3120356 RepID=UPI002FCDEC5C